MAIERVSRIDDEVKIKSALISVSDKTGLKTLVTGLRKVCGTLDIYSTGGTYTALQSIVGGLDSVRLIAVSDYTGQPEMRGGLVKTLDYRIYLGLLSETYNQDHAADISRLNAVPFDLTIVNLYPFASVVAAPDSDIESARGNIDIGGPAMLRASAKNFLRVTAVCDPADYEELIDHVAEHGGATRLGFRRRCAARVFRATAAYDAAVAACLADCTDEQTNGAYTIH
jgi:phosphoribosylaminoimidazolecarboxamide formyltransferase / IMP cyclohydrolase